MYSILQKKMEDSKKYKYASALWKIGLTFFLISILFLTPLIEIESTGHVDSDPFVLTYSYMFFEGGFRSIINSDFFCRPIYICGSISLRTFCCLSLQQSKLCRRGKASYFAYSCLSDRDRYRLLSL